MVRQIIEHSPESVVHRNAAGAYPIHLACALGGLDVVEYLVNVVTTSTSFASDMGAIPLHLAAYHGHEEVCKFLLACNSAQVSVRTTDGLLPEDAAKLGGHEVLVEMLAQIRQLQEERNQQDDSVLEEKWSLSVQHSLEAPGTSPLSGLAKYLSPSKQTGMMDTVDGEVLVSDEHTKIESRPISASIKTKFTLPTPIQLELSISSEAPDFRPAFSVEYSQPQDEMMDEFQRASLLEDEGERYHGPGENHGNFQPPELQDSLMFNLSEEIVLVDRNMPNNTTLSALPISGTTKQQQERDAVYFREFIEGTTNTVHKHSAFMFDASRKKATTQPPHSRPTTSSKAAYNPNQPLNIVSNNYEPRPTTASAAPPGGENAKHTTGGSPKHTVFHTVPLHHEVSVPGIIITSAAVLQSSPNTKQRVIRSPATTSSHRPRLNPATPAHTNTGPPHLNDSVSVLSIDLQGHPDMRSDITPPEQVYTLCKPLRPTSPRTPRSGGHKMPGSARGMRTPDPATTTTPTAAPTNDKNKNKQISQGEGTPASGEPISRSLAARRLQGKASPQQRQSAAPISVAVELPPVTRDKVLPIKHRWSQIRPVVLYSDELDAATEDSNKYPSNVTRGAFVPSKILRAKITAAELMSPSKQSKIDLTQMAQEAIRIAEDPAFTPTIQPVHYPAADGNSNNVKPQHVPAPAVPRAQMYEMFASPVATKPVHNMQAPILHIIPQAVVEDTQLEQLSL